MENNFTLEELKYIISHMSVFGSLGDRLLDKLALLIEPLQKAEDIRIAKEKISEHKKAIVELEKEFNINSGPGFSINFNDGEEIPVIKPIESKDCVIIKEYSGSHNFNTFLPPFEKKRNSQTELPYLCKICNQSFTRDKMVINKKSVGVVTSSCKQCRNERERKKRAEYAELKKKHQN